MNALQLRYHFTQEGDGDEFSVWIDDVLRFVVSGTQAGSTLDIALIDLDGFNSGRHKITFALHPYGDEPAEVVIKDLEFVTIQHANL